MVSSPEIALAPQGKGLVQRRQFNGEIAPDFYPYQCAFFGIAGATWFGLTADEIVDRADAGK
jgi:hypothetical protein